MKKHFFFALLSKKLSGEITIKESANLQRIIEEDEHYKQIAERLTDYFERNRQQLKYGGAAVNVELGHVWHRIALAEQQGFEAVCDYNRQPLRDRFTKSFLLKFAAALIVVLSCGILTFNLLNQEEPLNYSKLTTSDEKVFKTLDDGTRVCLNRGSSIHYNDNFGKKNRKIILLGEAFFDVAKNKDIPLFIQAGDINIEVKGTVFNVKAYQKNDRIEVSLLKGLVAVRGNRGKAGAVLLRPNEKLIALVGTSLNRETFQVVRMPVDKQLQDIKWIQDSLVFKKEKLQDLVLRLEKKYNIRIEIRKEELKNKRFSGTFAAEDLQQALEALKLSYPFTYTINNKLVIIK
ncbi:transmembrane sensor [Pedobacter africanus]|uniref:Ferric-dicitrate binding protein FerR (Iron transport regulator) n=1 Tax=Pedobacter africanus TaxID=151894 RepID=A0ACC6KZU9_9SPHI|nr:FecR family protein [Pedobacter africanus]MDR6784903.1 ferric-dicitrate binding protein FerR (iron transport regulator) [Pedobacter africanus]